jgi:hypothetical protein
MRIVNFNEFLTLPSGTVYMKFRPHVFDEICMKGRSMKDDFNYLNLTNEIECEVSMESIDKLERACRDSSFSFGLDFDCFGRDGLYDTNQLFAVYEKRDLEGLINRLQQCLKDAYDVKTN